MSNGSDLKSKAEDDNSRNSLGYQTVDCFSAIEKRRFDESWNSNNLEIKRREKLLRSNLRRANLYAEHLRNRDLIKEGNIFEIFYYSVKDLLTKRELQEEVKRGENSFLYFVN